MTAPVSHAARTLTIAWRRHQVDKRTVYSGVATDGREFTVERIGGGRVEYTGPGIHGFASTVQKAKIYVLDSLRSSDD